MEASARSNPFSGLAAFFRRYGLAFVMVASYFGSGSIFIASQAGVRYGYALIWAVLGSVLLGFMAQDMSARLGIFGKPLMAFTRDKLGTPIALVIAVWLAIGCVLWTLELTAAVGAGISILLGGVVGWQPIAPLVGLAAIVVGIRGYESVEHIMTFMMFALTVIYLIVMGASRPDVGAMLAGAIPSGETLSIAVLPLIAAILGTTALWPNFFLESILVREKGWTGDEHVPVMRRDLAIGYTVGGVITIAILVVAASVLRRQGVTELESFLTPGLALADVLGEWAMFLFVVGAISAAFNSIVPIMWAPAYLIPEALGHDPDSTSREFKIVYVAGVALGSLSPLVAAVTDLSVIDMIILFPAFNGIFGLPIAAVLLFWAINDRETMGTHENTLGVNLLNGILVVMAIVLATLSARGFVEAVAGGGI
ncbi:MAG: Nramp family divalent metal transporter [Gemmatimonadota bacterium]